MVAQMSISPQAALERLFTAPEIQLDWFDPAFLQQIPVSIESVITNLKRSLGPYQGVTEAKSGYLVSFEKGGVPAQIALNAQGQIIGLLFQEILSHAIALDEAIEQLKALPGRVHFLVREGNTELAALNADQPLAVGSAFKLAVLLALCHQIEAKQISWADVIELQPQDKTLPSGILQSWFDGALLTVQSLATLMISKSDNTATDALIRLVGRDAIELLTHRNQPFLTTREFFILKDPKNQTLLEQYRVGDEAKRRQVLQDLVNLPLPDVSLFEAKKVLAQDVEWFFTPRELCDLIEQVADLPLMSVNPGGGALNAADWTRVAFKGGSEEGVLNLTTWLQAETGKTYCVCLTWNHDQPLDEVQLLTIHSAAISGLKERN